MQVHHSKTIRRLGALVISASIVLGLAGGVAAEPSRYGSGQDTHVQMAPGNGGMLQAIVSPDEVVLGELAPKQPVVPLRLRAENDHVALGTGAGHGAMGSYKAGPGCMVQCITHGVAYARGVNSELRVWTDTPARIWIWVGSEDGSYSQFFSSPAGEEVSYFSALFEELEPHTTYLAMATAVDGQGYTSQASGSFTTLTRNVAVSFNHAHIIERPYGNDPFGWATWLEGEYLDTPGHTGVEALGDLLQLGIQTVELSDVDRHLGFALTVWQEDDGPSLCGAWALPGPGEPMHGAHSCTTWATASLLWPENDLDNRPANATSWTEHTIEATLVMPGSFDLDFSVPVTLQVTYD